MFPTEIFGVPTHPMLVHFPIGFYFGAFIFGIVALFSDKPVYRELLYWNLLLAVLFAVPTALTGLQQYNTIAHNERIHELMQRHMFINIGVVILMVLLTYWSWRIRKDVAKRVPGLLVALLVLGAAALTYSGHLGGLMVFEQGAAVAPAQDEIKASGNHGHSHDHTNGGSQEESHGHDDQHAH